MMRVPSADEGDDADDRPAKPRRSREKKRSAKSGVPLGIMLAMACVGVLMLLNLWELAAEDEAVWKFIAIIRLFVEGRVLWGLNERQPQTALSATIAATMMTLFSLVMLSVVLTDTEFQSELTPGELTATKVFQIAQALAEIGVVVGVNLPNSRKHLSQE